MKRSGTRPEGEAAAQQISQKIEALGDWRGAVLAKIRALVHAADPDIREEWKWMGTPVWSHDGIVCTGETYRDVVKMTFAKGASLPDPCHLFNSSLQGNTRRAIDIHEGEEIDAAALQSLVRAAVARNVAGRQPAPRERGSRGSPARGAAAAAGPEIDSTASACTMPCPTPERPTMQMPKPSKFHKKLAALIGDWSGDEVMHPSPWDPKGGKAKGRYKAREIADGFGVAQDYEQRCGGKVTFRGHGVFGYDAQQNCYLWHWSDSMSGVPCEATKGQWTGNQLVWQNQSPMGHARYTHTFLRGGKIAFRIETSQDGVQWSPMMEGLYTKKAAKG